MLSIVSLLSCQTAVALRSNRAGRGSPVRNSERDRGRPDPEPRNHRRRDIDPGPVGSGYALPRGEMDRLAGDHIGLVVHGTGKRSRPQAAIRLVRPVGESLGHAAQAGSPGCLEQRHRIDRALAEEMILDLREEGLGPAAAVREVDR